MYRQRRCKGSSGFKQNRLSVGLSARLLTIVGEVEALTTGAPHGHQGAPKHPGAPSNCLPCLSCSAAAVNRWYRVGYQKDIQRWRDGFWIGFSFGRMKSLQLIKMVRTIMNSEADHYMEHSIGCGREVQSGFSSFTAVLLSQAYRSHM